MRFKKRLPARKPVILLVEDESGDSSIVQECFKRCRVPTALCRVGHGEQALAFLRKEAPFTEAPTPDLVLLDLRLPVSSGIDVLRELHSDEQLKHIAVVVLTVSTLPEDVFSAYRTCCNTYLVKPLDFEEYRQMIEILCEYWFIYAKLPNLN